MSDGKESEAEISEFVHEIFLNYDYVEWRRNLESNEEGKWHSLIVSLD